MLLFLLFGIGIYEFIHAGLPAYAAICMLPIVVLAVIGSFAKHMSLFWLLMVVNYFVMWHNLSLPGGIPVSLYVEAIEILLLTKAIIDVKEPNFDRCFNPMLFALVVWIMMVTLEALNDTADLGYNFGAWYTGARLMGFQLLYAFLVYSIYINSPKVLMRYLFVWGGLTLFASIWMWKQSKFGPTVMENAFLHGRGSNTHIINGGTTIRYFSVYNDAATGGICLASSAVAFLIIGITTKIKKYRYFFLAMAAVAVKWGMMPTGTRTATFCLIAGLATYVILSKSFKIAIPVAILLGLGYFFMAFTNIGNGNAEIRRMRSGFSKNDASANQRTINQEIMAKYLRDAPFGLGVGMGYENVPPNNKFRKLATIAPDSEYVFIWIHTGYVGITIFLITTAIMFFFASWIVMFRLRSPSLRGIGAAMCCAFVSFQLGGYGNHVLMQFPNCMLCYGGLSIVYLLPHMESEWEKFEAEKLAIQTEKQRLKDEERAARRV